MKSLKLFAFAAMSLSLVLTGCEDEGPVAPGQVIQRGDSACRIESFILNLSGEETLVCDVYDYDKSIDVGYTTAQLEMMTVATATATLSEGATISPVPSAALDYTKAQSFTVTAKDGTTRTYITRPVEKVLETFVKVTPFVEKSATDMGLSDFNVYKKIGVSGGNLVVDTKVFNAKTLAPVGSLNMTGLTGSISWMGNDHAGHLVATTTPDGGSETAGTQVVCWAEGYDKPATIIVTSAGALGSFVSAGGNVVEGNGIITAVAGRGAPGGHHCLHIIDGAYAGGAQYIALQTQVPSNDGSWTQQVSPCSGDLLGSWFMFDSVGGGSNIYGWTNWAAPNAITMSRFTGTAVNGPDLWGNYSRGSVRAFTFDGKPYAATFTTGWPCTYVSIIDETGKPILSAADATLNYAISDANAYCPVGTYVYDEADKCGYMYCLVPGYVVKCWKVALEYL